MLMGEVPCVGAKPLLQLVLSLPVHLSVAPKHPFCSIRYHPRLWRTEFLSFFLSNHHKFATKIYFLISAMNNDIMIPVILRKHLNQSQVKTRFGVFKVYLLKQRRKRLFDVANRLVWSTDVFDKNVLNEVGSPRLGNNGSEKRWSLEERPKS